MKQGGFQTIPDVLAEAAAIPLMVFRRYFRGVPLEALNALS